MSAFVSVFATIGYAVPVFWTGIMLIILFASAIPIFPVEGMQSVKLRDAPFLTQALDVAHHLVLPAFTLAIIYLAQYARLSRASVQRRHTIALCLSARCRRTIVLLNLSAVRRFSPHAEQSKSPA